MQYEKLQWILFTINERPKRKFIITDIEKPRRKFIITELKILHI